ncbi:MAG: nucleoside triphosphate pyrophosphohydrolase [Chitinophagaceae bacterium]|nr:MAG: nucleoside triphosphate pyrophosphohydrolase [Chitinophagaceae bacterium]
MKINKTQESQAFEKLLIIMDELREKCPWDKKQTMETLRPLSIEELYELSDAIINNDLPGVKEELGDLMLHIVFYAKIAQEEKAFNITEVLNEISEKLVRRHPHVYGETRVENEEDVKKNWEKLKLLEGKTSVLSGVPQSLPSLIKAQRIQEKAAKVGFEWDKTEQVWEKVKEEIDELEEARKENAGVEKLEEEFGDILFALVNYARFIGVDPDNALTKTNKKFIRRFSYIEKEAENSGLNLNDMTLDQMDNLWNEAKKLKKN